MATALGVASSITGLLSFVIDLFPEPDATANKFRLKLPNDGYQGLSGAGGAKPDTRIWNPVRIAVPKCNIH